MITLGTFLKPSWLGSVLLACLSSGLATPLAYSQGISFPPEIRALMKKQKEGQELTEAEEATLEKWEEQLEKKLDAMDAPKPQQGKKAPTVLQGLPKAAPSREALMKLVREVAATYGKQAGTARGKIDEALLRSKQPTAGADLGALLLMSGGGSASVYACSQAVLKEPGDYLAVNNLGWALCGMDDSVRGISVLLYAQTLQPEASLGMINLGWAHYNAGLSDAAQRYFEQALKTDPESPAPHTGLGLIAQDKKQYDKVIEHLWLALSKRYSSMGAKAFMGARMSPTSGTSNEKPVSQERGATSALELPEPPVVPQIGQMAKRKSVLENSAKELEQRIQVLHQKFRSLSATYAQENINARRGSPGSALVMPRTFDKEMFLLQDIGQMTLGPPSRYGKAFQRAQGIYADLTRKNDEMAQYLVVAGEKTLKLGEELKACIEARDEIGISRVKHLLEVHEFEVCKRAKENSEINFDAHHRVWRDAWDAFHEASADYYAFTSPVLAHIYNPTLNEMQNVWRELVLLKTTKNLVQMGTGIAGLAEAHDRLKCVEPPPEVPPRPHKAASVGSKDPECPLEKPIVLPLVVATIELDCTKAKLEFGEILLGSIQRDYKKKETTFGFGVGFDTRNHILGGGMKMMAEMTVDGSGGIKDVAFNQSTSVTAFGLQNETTIRASMMGGPNDTSGFQSETKWDATGMIPGE